MRSAYAGGHGCWGVGHPGFALDEDVTGSVIESHARDSDWIARELGDVEYRHRSHIGELAYWPKGAATPDCIPVESLGRDQ